MCGPGMALVAFLFDLSGGFAKTARGGMTHSRQSSRGRDIACNCGVGV